MKVLKASCHVTISSKEDIQITNSTPEKVFIS